MDNMKENARFQPSPEQVKFAETWLDYSKKQTLEDIAKEIGIAYTTIWRWFQKNDFVDWINSKKDELLKNSLMARYKTAVRKAEAGDYNFSKLLFEIQGEYVQKSETKITQVNDEYEKLTDEEIVKEFANDLDKYRAHRQSGVAAKTKATKKD